MNKWQEHVKAEIKKNPGKPLSQVLKIAKGTYKKK
jgi:hypothetical protein